MKVQLSNAERTKLEMKRGVRQIHITMATGIIDQLSMEMGVVSKLISEGDDPRQWEVETELPRVSIPYRCGFWEFPTKELRATLMLLRGKR